MHKDTAPRTGCDAGASCRKVSDRNETSVKRKIGKGLSNGIFTSGILVNVCGEVSTHGWCTRPGRGRALAQWIWKGFDVPNSRLVWRIVAKGKFCSYSGDVMHRDQPGSRGGFAISWRYSSFVSQEITCGGRKAWVCTGLGARVGSVVQVAFTPVHRWLGNVGPLQLPTMWLRMWFGGEISRAFGIKPCGKYVEATCDGGVQKESSWYVSIYRTHSSLDVHCLNLLVPFRWFAT